MRGFAPIVPFSRRRVQEYAIMKEIVIQVRGKLHDVARRCRNHHAESHPGFSARCGCGKGFGTQGIRHREDRGGGHRQGGLADGQNSGGNPGWKDFRRDRDHQVRSQQGGTGTAGNLGSRPSGAGREFPEGHPAGHRTGPGSDGAGYGTVFDQRRGIGPV